MCAAGSSISALEFFFDGFDDFANTSRPFVIEERTRRIVGKLWIGLSSAGVRWRFDGVFCRWSRDALPFRVRLSKAAGTDLAIPDRAVIA
jgi:hypothetical protein